MADLERLVARANQRSAETIAAYERQLRHDARAWEEWRKSYASDALASAHALYYVNRWVKTDKDAPRRIYALKDRWIAAHQRYLSSGAYVRTEYGYDAYFDEEYERGTLWVHRFVVDAVPFCWHSYSRPTIVEEERSPSLASYGAPLLADEIERLPLPPERIFCALRHYLRRLG